MNDKNALFIGPMSLNIIEVVKECSRENIIGLVASRRQIEYDGGYVEGLTPKSLYYNLSGSKVILCRDHSGPGQGNSDDDGLDSLTEDCKYMNIIHIDPWKKAKSLQNGIDKTIQLIKFCIKKNPDILFEVGTEQAIFKMEPHELRFMIQYLKRELGPMIFKNILYAVIQSGTSLSGNQNTGKYDRKKLVEMVYICKDFGLLSKEHNGDYLPMNLIKEKMELGLSAINIAPEFGLIETNCILKRIKLLGRDDLLEKFFNLCLVSERWKKWVPKDYNPLENKEEIVKISGHYVFSRPELKSIKKELNNDLDSDIKTAIRNKIMEFYK